VSGCIGKLMRYGYAAEAHKLYAATEQFAATFDTLDVENLHRIGFDKEAHALFSKTKRLAVFNAHDIARLHQMVGFQAEAKKLFDDTVEMISAFDDTTVSAITFLQAAGLRAEAVRMYATTIGFADRWDINHIGKLKLVTLRAEAHDLYTKTMGYAAHSDTLAIIRELKAYGLEGEAADFESKVRARHLEKKKQRAKANY